MNVTKAVIDQEKDAQLTTRLTAVHPRFGLMWELGKYSGLRIGDLLRIRPGDIKQLLRITEQKTKKIREIDIEPELRRKIKAYVRDEGLADDDSLFYSRSSSKQKPMSRQWANAIIQKTAAKMGLESIGAHSMRKTFAVSLFRSTGSITAVKRVLNHKYESTTLIYLKDLLPLAR